MFHILQLHQRYENISKRKAQIIFTNQWYASLIEYVWCTMAYTFFIINKLWNTNRYFSRRPHTIFFWKKEYFFVIVEPMKLIAIIEVLNKECVMCVYYIGK